LADWIGRMLGNSVSRRFDGDGGVAVSTSPAVNGNGKAEKKGVTLSISPEYQFHSHDGMKTILQVFGGPTGETDRVTRDTAYAAAAYCYAAIRYRAKKVSEAPLMVIREDKDSGSEEWLPDHELAPLLDQPSPDLDMGELLQRTQTYIDIAGSALWLKQENNLSGVGGLVPYSGSEFHIESTAERIRGEFVIQTARGELRVPPERVIYFHEPNPHDWHRGLSLVDVALSWLNLGQAARAATQDILRNALFPSVIVQAHQDWSPDKEAWEEYKSTIEGHARRENRGDPLILTGGGNAQRVSLSLKDMIPSDILGHVESVVASVFGIPAVVLQFKVGLENSPWSQMSEARRMTYEDTIEPLWADYEKRLTRQLLWAPNRPGGAPIEDDRAVMVRFDTTRIAALRPDRQADAERQKLIEDIASKNERRDMVGLEPRDEPEADEMPSKAPAPPQFGGPQLAASGPSPRARKAADKSEDRRMAWLKFDTLTRAQESMWRQAAALQLVIDHARVVELADRHLTEAKSLDPRSRDRFLAELDDYMARAANPRWRDAVTPLVGATAESAVREMATTLGLSFDLLQPGLTRYIDQHAAKLVTQVTDTTKEAVRAAISAGVQEGEGVVDIAKRIRESDAAFGRSRSELIARTETTAVTNESQTATLMDYQEAAGVQVRKTWLASQDDRTREEHAELDGETKGVDEPFSNGLYAPGEPNCRCSQTFGVVEAG
jgi:HK97 family phage portal protein